MADVLLWHGTSPLQEERVETSPGTRPVSQWMRRLPARGLRRKLKMERGVRLGHRFRRATVALLAGAMLVGGCSTASTGAPEGSSSPSQAAPTATATEPTVSATAANELNALLPQAVREKGVLILGTDAEYPPCEYYDESGEMVGFEPDLWNAIGEKLGVEVKPESISFDGLMPGVESGRFDAAMECIADRPEREEKYTFVDFYYGAGGS